MVDPFNPLSLELLKTEFRTQETWRGFSRVRIPEVLHTPGHRPGAICLIDEENRLLVTGDSVCGEREDLIRMDKQIYIDSLRKLLYVDADMMIMSHPFMPAGKNILDGIEIREMIEASIKLAEERN